MNPRYFLFVGVAVLLSLAFPVARHIRGEGLRRQYYLLQAITLLGAVIGAKFSMLFGDLNWPWVATNDWHTVLWSGRSITGALIFGFLFAEIAKPMMDYAMPPNDRFAALLPFTIAMGRVGCLTAGCCQGLPCDSFLSMPGVDGVPRYPISVIEIVFQVGMGVMFLIMVKRGIWFGRLFSFYLIAYGVFRFGTEFIRNTPKFFGEFSGYQLLSLIMILLGTAFFLKRTFAPPQSWRDFQNKGLAPQTSPLEAMHA